MPGADSYDVQLYQNGQWIDLPGDGVETVFYGAGAIISELDPGSSLWFQVRARNALGSSDWSDFISMPSTNQFESGRRARPDNVAASGVVVVNGTPQTSEDLTADTTGIEDGNGLDRVQYRFQWVSNDGNADTDIQNATGSSYTLTAGDEGNTIKVRVNFTDRGGYAESLTSSATAVVGPFSNRVATGTPVITGTAQVGNTLRADTSSIADADGLANVSYSYQWIANDGTSDTDIQNATGSSYTLTAGDKGKTIKVRVSFTDDRGSEETLTSDATALVNSAATGTPVITGTAQVGQTLTVDTSSIADADGLANVSYSYQWIANDGTSDTDIQNATGSGYSLTAGDEGNTIKVRVSFTDDAANDETLTSAATAAVGPRPNSAATGTPVITGTAQVGQTLTVDTSSIADADGLANVSYSYQWIANDGTSDTDIQNATGSSYTLTASDKGEAIKVRVSFTDDAGNDETLTSDVTAVVAAQAQPSSGSRSFITVVVTEDTSDPNNVVTNFVVTWTDAYDCSTEYNAYLDIVGGVDSSGAGTVRMGLDVAGVNHQPLEIRVIQHRFQQPGPLAPVPPAAEAAMGVLPVPVVRRQIAPRGAGAQYPADGVDKAAVVMGWPPHLAGFSRQVGLQPLPNLVRKIVATMRYCHTPTSITHISLIFTTAIYHHLPI